jgi:tetratricopeptide (TPR) repeat protein
MNAKIILYCVFSVLVGEARSQCTFLDSCERVFIQKKDYKCVITMIDKYSDADRNILDVCRALYMLAVSYDQIGMDSLAKKLYQTLINKIEQRDCNKADSCKPLSTFMILSTYSNFANIYLRKGMCDSALNTLEKVKRIRFLGGGNDILEGQRKVELAFVEVALCQGDSSMALKRLFALVLNYRYGESKEVIDKTIELLSSKYSIDRIITEYQRSLKNIKLVTKVKNGERIDQYQTTFFNQILGLYNLPVMIFGDEQTPSKKEIKKYYFNNLFYKMLLLRKSKFS